MASPVSRPTEPVAAPVAAPTGARSPVGRLMGNGHYRMLLTTSGTGGAWLGDQALTSWRGDRIEDGDGWFVYLRDLDDGAYWSLGARPVDVAPDRYATEDGPGWMAIARRDGDLDARMETWVDAEADAECRLITLRNDSARPRRIELTSYAEVVLNDAPQHADHPGFSKLFVQTEAVAGESLVLAQRRPRSPEQRHPCLAHALRGEGSFSFETDRARFLGRGRGPDAPAALLCPTPLAGSAGAVLDPVLALRRVVEIAPGATARFELVACAGAGRDEVIDLARRLSGAEALDASRRRAEARAAERHASHRLSAEEAGRLERLAAALLYGDPGLARPSQTFDAPGSASGRGAAPIPGAVVVDSNASATTVNAMLAAHAYWRDLGLVAPMVLLTLEPGDAHARLAGVPGLRVIGPDALDARSLARLRAGADWLVADGISPLTWRPAATPRATVPVAAGDGSPATAGGDGAAASDFARDGTARPDGAAAWAADRERLRSFNGFGGFNARGTEYVIRLPQGRDGRPRLTPRPWINVLANPGFGAIISESGAGCTWSRNSRELRLTPWHNDPVCDPHDEALYLRDEETGRVWSPLPGPIPGEGPYEMRHGFGYSRCRHASQGLDVETDVFVHAVDPVKIVQVTIANRTASPRRISVTAYQRLVMGARPERAAREVSTLAIERRQILLARADRHGPYADAVAFAAPVAGAGRATTWLSTDREAFLGAGGSPRRPAALFHDRAPAKHPEQGIEPCFCIRMLIDLAPGESRSCAFLLGESPDPEATETIVRALRQPGAVAHALDDVRARWADRLGRVQVETPVESLDLLVNGWLGYQTLACRLWGRTAFYQSGGAYGFRDQLQDAAAFLAFDPQITRDQILLHAAHQFVEGDVLHWWHPAPGPGIRTRFADDLLWLPFVTATYVRTTGETGVLDETVPFLEGPALAPGVDEALLVPGTPRTSGDVYEHCCRAIDRSLATGVHGLPLFGSGDWNDGMNRAGREGRGESVWMGFFLCTVIDAFLPCCEARRDVTRIERWREHRRRLAEALDRAGWDGEWYRRGWYDDGTPMGSRASDECRIDALVQAWSVLSGAAPRERCEQAMDAVERELVSWDEGMIRLLAPPFDRTPHDPGYIKGYLPGVRENGGQYTHAALWAVSATAALGRREQAARMFEMLSPIAHARTPEKADRYQVEPYVVAADICANPERAGQGGWTWYTGSAGWMLRVALESILGVTLEGGHTLVVRAAIPPAWPGFLLRLRPWGHVGVCTISVRNTAPASTQVISSALDGIVVPTIEGVAKITLLDDGRDHQVDIALG